jgi:hypothetical protein
MQVAIRILAKLQYAVAVATAMKLEPHGENANARNAD